MSQLDQTRFVTLQKGIEVATDLELPDEQQRIKGDSFMLSLMVAIPYASDAEEPLDIIVDRISADTYSSSVLALANDDLVVETTARLEPEGTAFKIHILLQLEQMHANGAKVFVSKDMERIILSQLGRDLDQLLEEGLEG